MGEPVSLDLAALYDKIVRRRRGGFCYELNGLFAELLRRLGYRVTLLSAGVAQDGGGFGPEYDHLLLLVELDRRWMVDVGFGENFKSPLDLDAAGAQVQGPKAYRISAPGWISSPSGTERGRAVEGLRIASPWRPANCPSSRACAAITRPRRTPISPATASARWRRRWGARH